MPEVWPVAESDPQSLADIAKALHRDVRAIADGTKRWGRWSYDPKTGHLVLDDGSPSEYAIPLASCTTEAGRLDWLAQVAEKPWASEVIGDLVRALNDTYGLRQNDAFAGGRPARIRFEDDGRGPR